MPKGGIVERFFMLGMIVQIVANNPIEIIPRTMLFAKPLYIAIVEYVQQTNS